MESLLYLKGKNEQTFARCELSLILIIPPLGIEYLRSNGYIHAFGVDNAAIKLKGSQLAELVVTHHHFLKEEFANSRFGAIFPKQRKFPVGDIADALERELDSVKLPFYLPKQPQENQKNNYLTAYELYMEVKKKQPGITINPVVLSKKLAKHTDFVKWYAASNNTKSIYYHRCKELHQITQKILDFDRIEKEEKSDRRIKIKPAKSENKSEGTNPNTKSKKAAIYFGCMGVKHEC